jgi:hypothetical protein
MKENGIVWRWLWYKTVFSEHGPKGKPFSTVRMRRGTRETQEVTIRLETGTLKSVCGALFAEMRPAGDVEMRGKTIDSLAGTAKQTRVDAILWLERFGWLRRVNAGKVGRQSQVFRYQAAIPRESLEQRISGWPQGRQCAAQHLGDPTLLQTNPAPSESGLADRPIQHGHGLPAGPDQFQMGLASSPDRVYPLDHSSSGGSPVTTSSPITTSPEKEGTLATLAGQAPRVEKSNGVENGHTCPDGAARQLTPDARNFLIRTWRLLHYQPDGKPKEPYTIGQDVSIFEGLIAQGCTAQRIADAAEGLALMRAAGQLIGFAPDEKLTARFLKTKRDGRSMFDVAEEYFYRSQKRVSATPQLATIGRVMKEITEGAADAPDRPAKVNQGRRPQRTSSSKGSRT